MEMRNQITLVVLLFCKISFGYLVLENGAADFVVVLRNGGQVVRAACGRLPANESFLEQAPAAVVAACKQATNSSVPVPELDFIKNLAAIYGVPTWTLGEMAGIDFLSQIALAGERSFRTSGSKKTGEWSDAVISQLWREQDDVLQFLDGGNHRQYSNLVLEERGYARAVEMAFYPIFSDGSTTLQLLSSYPLERIDQACQPQWAVASVTSLLRVLADARARSELVAWTRAKLNKGAAPFNIGTWHYATEKKEAVSRANTFQRITGYAHRDVLLQLTVSPQSIEWANQNELGTKVAPGTAAESLRGYGTLFTAANANQSLPLFCLRRVAPFAYETPQNNPKGGGLRVAELAAVAKVPEKKFLRIILNEPEWEKALAPLLVWDEPLEAKTAKELTAKAVELFGPNLPEFDQLVADDAREAQQLEAQRLRQQQEQARADAMFRQQQAQAEATRRLNTIPFSLKNNTSGDLNVEGRYIDAASGLTQSFRYRLRAGQTGFIGNAARGNAFVSAESVDGLSGDFPEFEVKLDNPAGLTQGLGLTGRRRR